MMSFRSASVIGLLFLITVVVAAWTTPVPGSEKGKRQGCLESCRWRIVISGNHRACNIITS
jgi:hypothetical protein